MAAHAAFFYFRYSKLIFIIIIRETNSVLIKTHQLSNRKLTPDKRTILPLHGRLL